MLLGLDLKVEIVIRDREGFPIQRESADRRGTQQTQEAQWLQPRLYFGELHFSSDERRPARRCLTISYKTTAAATETFSDGTFPSIGIETRKSHLRFTRSCRPLPSPPITSAQSIL